MSMMRDMPWLEYKAYLDFLIRTPWFLNPYFSYTKKKKKSKKPKVARKPEDFPAPKPMTPDQLAANIKDLDGP